jgi:hypothetical protein
MRRRVAVFRSRDDSIDGLRERCGDRGGQQQAPDRGRDGEENVRRRDRVGVVGRDEDAGELVHGDAGASAPLSPAAMPGHERFGSPKRRAPHPSARDRVCHLAHCIGGLLALFHACVIHVSCTSRSFFGGWRQLEGARLPQAGPPQNVDRRPRVSRVSWQASGDRRATSPSAAISRGACRGAVRVRPQPVEVSLFSLVLAVRACCLMNRSTSSNASSSTICFGGDFIR